jgi:hypothetical protein
MRRPQIFNGVFGVEVGIEEDEEKVPGAAEGDR